MARFIVLLFFIYLVLALAGYLDECQSLQRQPTTRFTVLNLENAFAA